MSIVPQNHRPAEGVELFGRGEAVPVASGLAEALNCFAGEAVPPDNKDSPAPVARGVSR